MLSHCCRSRSPGAVLQASGLKRHGWRNRTVAKRQRAPQRVSLSASLQNRASDSSQTVTADLGWHTAIRFLAKHHRQVTSKIRNEENADKYDVL